MDRMRRTLVQGILAAPAVIARAAEPRTLKISHQFPGGTIDEGDFRDRLCLKFAAELEKRSGGSLKGVVYPNSSLMKTNAQFSSMRKGALDMSLVPLSYAGGEVPETNIGLMPATVISYEQGTKWKTAEVGRELANLLADKNIVVVSWIWQAGGVASRGKPLIEPEDANGMKVRGGSREMDRVLKAAGAAVISMPSDEIYAAMNTGACDAAMTSSTSLISYRLEEVAKSLTTGRGKAYWFMFEPLLMSRQVFESLAPSQQTLVMSLGAELERFALDGARADDQKVASIYEKKGLKVYDLSEATVRRWQAISRDTAWQDYAQRSDSCKKLLALAEKTL